MTDKVITIYCDGSCSADGAGGYAATLTYPGARKLVVYGGEPGPVTNQQMELLAAIAGLAAIKKPGNNVKVFSDSAYVVNCFRDGWMINWRRKDWRHKGGERPNRVYWEQLDELVSRQVTEFIHVRGHVGNVRNEEVDVTAVNARIEVQLTGVRFKRLVKEETARA